MLRGTEGEYRCRMRVFISPRPRRQAAKLIAIHFDDSVGSVVNRASMEMYRYIQPPHKCGDLIISGEADVRGGTRC